MQSKDEKNFAAGIEDNTVVNIQIPKRNVDDVINEVEKGDRIILSNLQKDLKRKVKVESVNTANVFGKIKRQGRNEGLTGNYKKAVVQLAADSKSIEFFDSLT